MRIKLDGVRDDRNVEPARVADGVESSSKKIYTCPKLIALDHSQHTENTFGGGFDGAISS